MGQPYLVQMIGSYVWDDAEDLAREVTAEGVRRAVDDASRHCCQHVHGPVRHRLSNLDKRFLAWMLPDASTSAIAAVGGTGHGGALSSVALWRRCSSRVGSTRTGCFPT